MLSDKEISEFKRGPLQMLVLFLLKERDMYGYSITQEIKRRSQGEFFVSESVLYVVLYRLEQKGYISKRKEDGVKKAKVFYHLEPSGQSFLSDLLDTYLSIHRGIGRILDHAVEEEQ